MAYSSSSGNSTSSETNGKVYDNINQVFKGWSSKVGLQLSWTEAGMKCKSQQRATHTPTVSTVYYI